MIGSDEGGYYRFVGERAESILGISSDPVAFEERFLSRVPEEYRGRHDTCARATTTGEDPETVEIPFDRPDGERIWLLFTSVLQRSFGPEEEEKFLVSGIMLDITEKKRHELELETVNTRLQLALESTSTGTFEWNIETNEVVWDETSERLFGYEPGEFPGRYEAWAGRVHPEDLPEAKREIERALETGETYDVVFRVETPETSSSEEERWIRARGSVEYDAEGSPMRMVGIHSNVTEQKRREQELRRQKVLLDQAQRLTGAWMADLRTGEVSWSEEGYRIHELDSGTELSLKETFEFLHPEALPEVRQAFDRCVEEGKPYDVEHPIVTAAGNKRWVRTVGAPAQVEDGKVVRVAGAFQDITERKTREKKLEQTTARLTALYNNSPDMINVHDLEGRIIDPNPRFLEKMGYDQREVEGLRVWEINQEISPDEAEELWTEMEPGDRVELEGAYQQKDGSVFPAEIHIRRLDLEGEGRFMVISRDITERKERKQATRERQQKVKSLYEAADRLMMATSHGTVGDRIHELLTETFDLPLMGVSLVDEGTIVPKWIDMKEGFDLPPAQPLDVEGDGLEAKAIRSGEVVVEEHLPELDNEIPYGDLRSAAYVPIGKRGVLYLGGVEAGGFDTFDLHLLDVLAAHAAVIFDRIEREERLAGRRRKIEALFEATRRLLEAGSAEDVFGRIHEVLRDVFDYPLRNTSVVERERLVPARTTVNEAVDIPRPTPQPRDGDTVSGRALQAGDTVVVENVETLENDLDYGEMRSAAGIPVGDRGAIVIGQIESSGFDPFNLRMVEVLASYAALILSQLDRQGELLAAKEEAEEAAQLKAAVLANMSHEIRTPLTSIIGFAEVLEGKVEGEGAELAKRIHRGGKRLMKTLDSVLELSRLEAGTADLSREEVSLNKVAEDATRILRPSVEEKSIALETDLPRGPARGHWNEGALNRITENLLENAIKFTPEGGTIWVRVRDQGPEAVLEVEDTGIGISGEVLPRIFEPFKQESEGLGRDYEGTGLGLSIVRRLAEAHGGSVEAESEKGKGTCFTVRLPMGPCESDVGGP